MPISFFSRKLNLAQMKHTTTEKELLAIVETLKGIQKHSIWSTDKGVSVKIVDFKLL
jgi:hypothetical protein